MINTKKLKELLKQPLYTEEVFDSHHPWAHEYTKVDTTDILEALKRLMAQKSNKKRKGE